VGGWDCQNREDNFYVDLDGDGVKEVVSAINGSWNRVTVWDSAGTPLYNAQFGPGDNAPRANLRAMDVADLDGNGQQEIVVATSAGLVVVLDHQCRKLWAQALPSPPTVLRVVKPATGLPWIVVGCEDGTVVFLDGQGEWLRRGRVSGRPVAIEALESPTGPLAVLVTGQGEVTGFSVG
jgi:hypothetical protein